MSRENIAMTLKRLRERAGYTIYQVGEMVGKSGKTIGGWENNKGQPDAEMLMLLCDIYEVDDILDEFRQDIKKAPDVEIDVERDKLLGFPHVRIIQMWWTAIWKTANNLILKHLILKFLILIYIPKTEKTKTKRTRRKQNKAVSIPTNFTAPPTPAPKKRGLLSRLRDRLKST